MSVVDPAIVRSHIAKVGVLASQHPHLYSSLEGICSVLDTAISVGVPSVGQAITEKCGRLEISRATFNDQPYVLIEWPEALADSPDIIELIQVLKDEGVSTTYPGISPYSLILIGLYAA